jgi:hypothetical protein
MSSPASAAEDLFCRLSDLSESFVGCKKEEVERLACMLLILLDALELDEAGR